MRYAVFDQAGFPQGFYSEEIHGFRLLDGEPNPDCTIPTPAIGIDDEQWVLFVSNPASRRWQNGAVVEYQSAPVDPVVVMPTLTPRQFWLAASRINVSKADVLALVDAMDDKQAAADLRIEITEAVSFERSNPAIDEVATLLGISGEQLDSLWVWAAGF
ncbi:hypothetical protein FS827_14915 [Agrobacterium vitis]|uniref:hypothetical protein n=1 Tax=Allorhizobium ampelinum TaxID=3025782 RepID=UPI001F1DA7F2|nr:hypothetical protein [Allorhizobium ampelinum]MCF1462601.1 hypothetical protein [Allorhizobium ampelinum]